MAPRQVTISVLLGHPLSDQSVEIGRLFLQLASQKRWATSGTTRLRHSCGSSTEVAHGQPRARVPHRVEAPAAIRGHTISGRGFNLFKPLRRHFRATPFCRQVLSRRDPDDRNAPVQSVDRRAPAARAAPPVRRPHRRTSSPSCERNAVQSRPHRPRELLEVVTHASRLPALPPMTTPGCKKIRGGESFFSGSSS